MAIIILCSFFNRHRCFIVGALFTGKKDKPTDTLQKHYQLFAITSKNKTQRNNRLNGYSQEQESVLNDVPVGHV